VAGEGCIGEEHESGTVLLLGTADDGHTWTVNLGVQVGRYAAPLL
jgi:hypothetical protein